MKYEQALQVQQSLTAQKKVIEKGYKLNTIQDLEKLQYGYAYQGRKILAKADDILQYADSNIHNTMYGPLVWEQFNMRHNLFGALAKEPWLRSGDRVKKARGVHVGSAAYSDDLPDADHPDVEKLNWTPRVGIHQFAAEHVQQLLSTLTMDDDIGDPMEWLRNETRLEHLKDINEFLNVKVTVAPGGSTGNDWETIDRALSSTAEITAHSLTAGREDFGGIDRSANAWYDSGVSYDAVANRKLTKDLIRGALRTTRPHLMPYGQKFWYTNTDTIDEISKLYEGHARFDMNAFKISPSVNGIQVYRPGHDFGVDAASLYGYPIVWDEDCPSDGIGRLYFIDSGSLHLGMLELTKYYEQGVITGNPWAKNKMINAGLLSTTGQLRLRRANSCYKVRDLE